MTARPVASTRRWWRREWVALLLALPLLASCASSGGASSGSGPQKLRVGLVTVSALQWPYYVAIDKGFYKDAGIDVQVTVADSNAKAVQGLIAKSLEIAAGSPDASMRAIAEGQNLTIAGSVVNKPIYTLVAAKGMKDYSELKGKRVGVSGVKSMDGLWMRELLKRHGLDPDKDVQIVEIGGTSQRYAALKTGGVQAALLTQPADFQALREGFADLGKSSEIASDITWSAYTLRKDWAQANSDLLVRFLEVQRRAAKWLYDPANRDEALRVLEKNTNSEQADATATYDLWIGQKVLAPRSEATAAGIQTMIDSLVNIGGLPKPLTVDQVFDPSYMQKAAEKVP